MRARAGFTILILLTSLAAAVPQAQRLIFRDVTLVDGTGAARRGLVSVVVEGEKIAAIRAASEALDTSGARVVDGTGKFLIPGLWDMHVHLTVTPDQAVSRDVMLPLFLRFGVVGVRDMGGDPARIDELRKEIAAGRPGPAILSPGPFVDGPQPPSPMVVPVGSEAEARAAVRDLARKKVDFIKVQSGLSIFGWRAVLDEAKKLKMPVEGHVPEAVSAWELGRSTQRTIEHVSAALPGDAGILLACSREEDLARAELLALTRDSNDKTADRAKLRERRRALQARLLATFDPDRAASLFKIFVDNRITVVPTQVWSRAFAPTQPAVDSEMPLDALPAEMREKWRAALGRVIDASTQEDFAFRRSLADNARMLVASMHKAGVKLLAGTDTIDAYVIPGYSLHQELELMVQSGLTPLQALQSATRDAARFLGREKMSGTVEVGKRADLVMLSADPLADIRNTRGVEAVVVGGRVISAPAPKM